MKLPLVKGLLHGAGWPAAYFTCRYVAEKSATQRPNPLTRLVAGAVSELLKLLLL